MVKSFAFQAENGSSILPVNFLIEKNNKKINNKYKLMMILKKIIKFFFDKISERDKKFPKIGNLNAGSRSTCAGNEDVSEIKIKKSSFYFKLSSSMESFFISKFTVFFNNSTKFYSKNFLNKIPVFIFGLRLKKLESKNCVINKDYYNKSLDGIKVNFLNNLDQKNVLWKTDDGFFNSFNSFHTFKSFDTWSLFIIFIYSIVELTTIFLIFNYFIGSPFDFVSFLSHNFLSFSFILFLTQNLYQFLNIILLFFGFIFFIFQFITWLNPEYKAYVGDFNNDYLDEGDEVIHNFDFTSFFSNFVYLFIYVFLIFITCYIFIFYSLGFFVTIFNVFLFPSSLMPILLIKRFFSLSFKKFDFFIPNKRRFVDSNLLKKRRKINFLKINKFKRNLNKRSLSGFFYEDDNHLRRFSYRLRLRNMFFFSKFVDRDRRSLKYNFGSNFLDSKIKLPLLQMNSYIIKNPIYDKYSKFKRIYERLKKKKNRKYSLGLRKFKKRSVNMRLKLTEHGRFRMHNQLSLIKDFILFRFLNERYIYPSYLRPRHYGKQYTVEGSEKWLLRYFISKSNLSMYILNEFLNKPFLVGREKRKKFLLRGRENIFSRRQKLFSKSEFFEIQRGLLFYNYYDSRKNLYSHDLFKNFYYKNFQMDDLMERYSKNKGEESDFYEPFAYFPWYVLQYNKFLNLSLYDNFKNLSLISEFLKHDRVRNMPLLSRFLLKYEFDQNSKNMFMRGEKMYKISKVFPYIYDIFTVNKDIDNKLKPVTFRTNYPRIFYERNLLKFLIRKFTLIDFYYQFFFGKVVRNNFDFFGKNMRPLFPFDRFRRKTHYGILTLAPFFRKKVLRASARQYPMNFFFPHVYFKRNYFKIKSKKRFFPFLLSIFRKKREDFLNFKDNNIYRRRNFERFFRLSLFFARFKKYFFFVKKRRFLTLFHKDINNLSFKLGSLNRRKNVNNFSKNPNFSHLFRFRKYPYFDLVSKNKNINLFIEKRNFFWFVYRKLLLLEKSFIQNYSFFRLRNKHFNSKTNYSFYSGENFSTFHKFNLENLLFLRKYERTFRKVHFKKRQRYFFKIASSLVKRKIRRKRLLKKYRRLSKIQPSNRFFFKRRILKKNLLFFKKSIGYLQSLRLRKFLRNKLKFKNFFNERDLLFLKKISLLKQRKLNYNLVSLKPRVQSRFFFSNLRSNKNRFYLDNKRLKLKYFFSSYLNWKRWKNLRKLKLNSRFISSFKTKKRKPILNKMNVKSIFFGKDYEDSPVNAILHQLLNRITNFYGMSSLGESDYKKFFIRLRKGYNKNISFHKRGKRNIFLTEYFFEKKGSKWLSKNFRLRNIKTFRNTERSFLNTLNRRKLIFSKNL